MEWLTWSHLRLLALAGLIAWGGWGQWRVAQYEAQAAADALARSETDRESERLAARNNQRISDELLTAQRQRHAASRASAQRLRDLAEARAAANATAAACQRYEGAPVDVIPGAVRERIGELFDEADEISDRLRACQAYVADVVRPVQ